jgi:pimeloyl-ACP methyl ester carboxylesterase
MARSTATPDGVDVAGADDADPIVFVHGAVFSRAMWAPQRDALDDQFRVVAPDLPGHGTRSDVDFRLASAVDVVDDAVEEHADGSAHVVGLSLGGYVSTAYAGRYPEKVDGLVLSGSSANPEDVLATLSRGIGGVTRLATRSERVEDGIRGLAERWVRRRNLHPAQEREIIDAGFSPRQFGVAGREIAGVDFRGMLADYPDPVLVLNGGRDLVNRRGEEAHAAAARDGRVEVIDAVGHTCNLHRPSAYTGAVRRFHERTVTEHPTV